MTIEERALEKYPFQKKYDGHGHPYRGYCIENELRREGYIEAAKEYNSILQEAINLYRQPDKLKIEMLYHHVKKLL